MLLSQSSLCRPHAKLCLLHISELITMAYFTKIFWKKYKPEKNIQLKGVCEVKEAIIPNKILCVKMIILPFLRSSLNQHWKFQINKELYNVITFLLVQIFRDICFPDNLLINLSNKNYKIKLSKIEPLNTSCNMLFLNFSTISVCNTMFTLLLLKLSKLKSFFTPFPYNSLNPSQNISVLHYILIISHHSHYYMPNSNCEVLQ